jgi:hypothetical protein
MRTAIFVTALILGCGTSELMGHEVLGPVQVNQILRNIQQAQLTLRGNASPKEKETALFYIGAEAYTLMKLINSDVREHGQENQGLIDVAIGRCKKLGVNIQPVSGTDYYLYDFEAFTSYLKIAPRGMHAPEARFALIEKSSYSVEQGRKTPEMLLKQIEEKKNLLQEFPDVTRRVDLQMFLILDYLEVYASYLESNDLSRSNQYKELALELCRQLVENHPDTGAANFARDLLIKFGI